MKKIIITLCGLLVANGAIAAHDVQEPKTVDVSPWWNDGSYYETEIKDFYTNIANRLHDDRPKAVNRKGTWGDEDAIIIWAARDIYAHGAKFCPVQIQAANDTDKHIWLDYHWNEDDEDWDQCIVLCTAGYSGNGCAEYSGSTCFLNDIPLAYSTPKDEDLLHEGDTYRKTKKMTVLSYENNDGVEATHVVLGIVGKPDQGRLIAPIKVIGKRDDSGNIKSWVTFAKSNGRPTLLCKNGYIANNDGTECIQSNNCNNNGWCGGYETGFKSEIHYKFATSNNCNEYRCSADNYGFDESKNCVPCETSLRQGVNNKGVCEKCGPNGIFITNGCKYDTRKISKYNMETCWKQKSLADFATCMGVK